jgi:hypothetical protein
MVTREVGRDRLLSLWLSRGESYERRREVSNLVYYRYIIDIL